MKIDLTMKEIYATVSALDHAEYIYRMKRKENAVSTDPDKAKWDAIYENETKIAGHIKQMLLKTSDEQRSQS